MKPIYEQIAAMDHLGEYQAYRRPQSASAPTAFGKPGSKPSVDMVDLVALLLSVVCLVAAICTISPRLSIAWHLGYTSQIIVVGFLLSIMNLCLGRVSPALFLIIEARFGQSTLQNYEAILRNQPLSTTPISLIWRIILLIFIALPLGLSAGYKRYTGGAARALIPDRGVPLNMYGTTSLPGFNNVGSSVGYAEFVNASLPFMIASRNDSEFPTTFPQPYGHNMLLISNTTAALLDLPMPNLVTSLQRNLATGETKTLSATVHAFVTTYNQSVEQHREDPTYWNQYLDNSYRLNGVSMYTGWFVYTLMNNFGGDTSWCFVAVCQKLDDFDQTALRFDTYRHLCQATWEISAHTVNLVQASCDEGPLPPNNQTIITQDPLATGVWYTPLVADYIGSIGTGPATAWLLPTYVTTIATMYWARVSALRGPSADGSISSVDDNTYPYQELYYSVDNQVVYSTRPSVNAKWSLYSILVIQPFLTILILIFKASLYSGPIGEGFGLVTILAGANTEALHSLEGAALTGRLRRPVRMAIGVRDELNTRFADEQQIPPKGLSQRIGRIQFTVNGQERNGELIKGLVYA